MLHLSLHPAALPTHCVTLRHQFTKQSTNFFPHLATCISDPIGASEAQHLLISLLFSRSPSTQNQIIRAASTPATNTPANDDEDGEVVVRRKEPDEAQLTRDGALNQFISELSLNIHGRRYTETPSKAVTVNDEVRTSVSATADRENGPKAAEQAANEPNDKVSDSAAVVERSSQSDLPAKPSHFVTVIEVKESKDETSTTTTTASAPPRITTSATSSFKSVRSGYENVIIENNKRNSNLINDMDRSSNTTSSFTSSFNQVRPSAPAIALLQDAKKKIPPRWVPCCRLASRNGFR